MTLGLTILQAAKYVAPVLLLLSSLYEYRLQSPKTQTHKRRTAGKYVTLFIAGVLGLVALAYDDWERSKREEQERIYRAEQDSRGTAFRQEQRNREAVFTNQVSHLAEQQASLVKEYDRILMALATNSTPNPALLASLAATKERLSTIDTGIVDLKAWVAELANRRDLLNLRAKQVRLQGNEDDKAYLAPYLPIWDYTMERLLVLLQELSRQRGLSLTSDYRQLPSLDSLCPADMDTQPPWRDKHFRVATVTFGTNVAWTCECVIARLPNMRENLLEVHRPSLRIQCRTTNETHLVRVRPSTAELELPGSPRIVEVFPSADFKKGVDTILRHLIAAEAETLGTTER